MRRHNPRPPLPAPAAGKLDAVQAACDAAEDPAGFAKSRWPAVRRLKWFERGPRAVLARMAGPGEPCMYCDAGEGHQVEHFWPKATCPGRAFDWSNFLWICGLCNTRKGDRFPLQPDGSPSMLEPATDDPWRHARINRLGQVVGLYDTETESLDPRAEATIRALRLNREALQERRLRRMRNLKRRCEELLRAVQAGELSRALAAEEVDEELESPHQPDVAQYFLDGPGRDEEPFARLLAAIGR